MPEDLGGVLAATWSRQARAGFMLGDPDAPVEERTAHDESTGVTFRFRWLPHRELRGDAAALEEAGILDPGRDRAALFHDPRDPLGRHCFLCPGNVRICHPAEELLPVDAGGRRWWVGVNFAWLASQHFTVMAAEHVDQVFDSTVIDAMVELHRRTKGAFRVLFNPPDAGATIPWHLHLQMTSASLPLERLLPGSEDRYPTRVWRFAPGSQAVAAQQVSEWLEADPGHRANLLAAGNGDLFVIPREASRSHAARKGLMGGFEVAGDFVFSDPPRRSDFERADLASAVSALREIEPGRLRGDRPAGGRALCQD